MDFRIKHIKLALFFFLLLVAIFSCSPEIGPRGAKGDVGPHGEIGAQGAKGDVGPQGEIGPRGAKGDVGPQGEIGPQGVKGDGGERGSQGEIGPQGVKGDGGERGSQGEIGPQGAKGDGGERGSQGKSGPQGEQGPVGPQGEKGADEIVVYQSDSGYLFDRTKPDDNLITVIDSVGDVGQYSSITIGYDGFGLISYYDNTNQDLKVAHCNNIACTESYNTSIDSEGNVGQYTSIVLGADGLGLISYYDVSNQALKVAHCSNIFCTDAVINTIDNDGAVGSYSSLTIGSDGLGLISYYDIGSSNLRVAHCLDILCTEASNITVVDFVGDVGTGTSIVLGADGLGVISYYDISNKALKIAHCSNKECTEQTISEVDVGNSIGEFTSMTIDRWGHVLMVNSMHDEDLEVVSCSNFDCTLSYKYDLDTEGDVGSHNSITIGSHGFGSISYYDATNGDLKIANCSNQFNIGLCEVASTSTLDSEGDVGRYPSITINPYGSVLITYYDFTKGDLKILHCENSFCVPYFRLR